MLGLTGEQMIEIGRARERLRAIHDKAQPYPDEPLPVQEQEPISHEPPWSRDQWQYIQQLRAQVNYLNNKVTETRIEKKERKVRFKGAI